ncbi:vanZ family protein [Clostridium sp. CAG:914]|mgnify:CR=1 FL=1|nr:vanZ family protein [Clostridium sp. CAG:914]
MLLWMFLIFLMSSFDATESTNQSNFIVNIITNIFKIENIELLSFIIRKLAHFTEYLILGLLVANMFTKNNINNLYLISIILCIIYATSDEIHQLFVPGRACQLRDILIDSIGSITGVYLYKLINTKILKK